MFNMHKEGRLFVSKEHMMSCFPQTIKLFKLRVRIDPDENFTTFNLLIDNLIHSAVIEIADMGRRYYGNRLLHRHTHHITDMKYV